MRFIPGKNFLSSLNILFIFFSLLDREKDREKDIGPGGRRNKETEK
jgi:hypothetical protein